jgi:hypothetical protein
MKTKFFWPAVAIIILCASLIGRATLGDLWAIASGNTDVWRITSSGNLQPGADSTYAVGSSSAKVSTIYADDAEIDAIKHVPVTVTANATLADNTYAVFVGSINGNRTYVLPTPTIGRRISIIDPAGHVNVNGNVTIDGASTNTVNGAANVTFSETYGRVELIGVSTTAWVASEAPAP